MQNKIYVGNLSYSLGEAELREAFSPFGEVTDVTLPKDRVTGRARGFAFVTYATGDQAEAALVMDGKELSGRKMVVKFAEQRKEGGGGGGGGRHHHSGGNRRDERSERW